MLFDIQQPMWFHYNCFFKKNKPKQITEIAGFGNLRWEDQEKVKQHFSGSHSSTPAIAVGATVDDSRELCDYQVDYAKSNRSKCKVCENSISKEEVRIAIMVDGNAKYTSGKIPAWHHVECFIAKQKEEPEHGDISEQDIAG